jgi:uncharacterized damage-inducible protein DinB
VPERIGHHFRSESRRLLESYLERILAATGKLDAAQLWWRPHAGSNSVANLMLHLEGNLSQWVLDGLAGERYERQRDAEFASREGADAAELRERLRQVFGRCVEAVDRLEDRQLLAEMRVQGYATTGLAALYHAVEHASYHTGQIVAAAKQLLGPGSGIDFYPQHRGE